MDLIYLDPPFNSGRQYSAPIGSEAAGAAFKDTWTLSDINIAEQGIIRKEHKALHSVIKAAGVAHSPSMRSYMIYMGIRLIEMRRILKSTGSIYLHCDQNASAWLKAMMDAVFGKDQLRNEIVWHYGKWTNATSFFQRNHDMLLFYSKGDGHTFNKVRRTDTPKHIERGYTTNRIQGVTQLLVYDRNKAAKKIAEGSYDKIVYRDSEEEQKVAVADVWNYPIINSQANERTGYPTQKPLALLERIILASSNEGDMVLDPFCGCATACVAAEKYDRQWVGIDVSSLAYNSTENKERLFGRQRGYCNGCERHFEYRNLTIDHIVPQGRGGGHYIDNLQLLCGACNSTKGTGTQAELIAKLLAQGIRQ